MPFPLKYKHIDYGKNFRNFGTVFSHPEEIIEEAKAGRIFILVDDEHRENEGDLVIPAEKITSEDVNFMVREGRGLVCLALHESIVDRLELAMLPQRHESRYGTAFTVSIEAREGISTGISAADRACTIRTAVDPNSTANDIATPGHVFPLKARKGGVMERRGHTEAAVDISALAGLVPAGVICEIMNEDGTMARMPDIEKFAAHHNMKVGTVAALVDYQLKNRRN
jgi:3,4-dihydroxy 2-butanone 4-phosphate synthase/GTP cyclohydrolase II